MAGLEGDMEAVGHVASVPDLPTHRSRSVTSTVHILGQILVGHLDQIGLWYGQQQLDASLVLRVELTLRMNPDLVGLVLDPIWHREHQQDTGVTAERIDSESLFCVEAEPEAPIC